MGSSVAIIKVVEKKQSKKILLKDPVIMIGGADIISEYNKLLDRMVAIYNRRLEKLSSPYFLRTDHTSNGYEYPGRYFYKWVWDEIKGRMLRKYVGLVVPENDEVPEGGFPTAPVNALEGFEYRVIYHDIICTQEMYERFFRFFEKKKLMVLKLKVQGE